MQFLMYFYFNFKIKQKSLLWKRVLSHTALSKNRNDKSDPAAYVHQMTRIKTAYRFFKVYFLRPRNVEAEAVAGSKSIFKRKTKSGSKLGSI